jgi:hypothetical protein
MTDPEQPAPRVFRWTSAALRYALHCPDQMNLREALAFAVDVGMQAERIDDVTYRLTGEMDLAEKVREWIAFYVPDGFATIDIEGPPASPQVRFVSAPRAAYVRSALVHAATDYARLVALAVDAGLAVECAGVRRYLVTGATRNHLVWVASFLGITHAQALERLSITQAQADAEDSGPPPITVRLPTRETKSVIERDRDGDIRTLTQVERSI